VTLKLRRARPICSLVTESGQTPAFTDVELRSLFHQLADNIQEIFWIIEAGTWQVVYASPAYEKIWGRPHQEIAASHEIWRQAIGEEGAASFIRAFSSLMNGAPETTVEYRVLRPDGTVRWVSDHSFPIRNEEGHVYRIAGIAKDITEKKLLDEHLRHAQKMDAIGQLASGVAHDFNNIFGCILGYAELATADLSDPHALGEHLQEISRACLRGRDLIERVEAFSNTRPGRKETIALQSVISGAVEGLRSSLPATIELSCTVDDRAPRVRAEVTDIQQVLVNLTTNSAEAIEGPGHIDIALTTETIGLARARLLPGLGAGPYVKLSVSDTGAGMEDAIRSRIFEPFFTTKPPGKNSGLGLPVVHGIVKRHEGAIDVKSTPGLGTTFDIYLPAHESPADSNGARSAGNG
jgi:PAS domain S-box-containing protein